MGNCLCQVEDVLRGILVVEKGYSFWVPLKKIVHGLLTFSREKNISSSTMMVPDFSFCFAEV